MTPFAWGLAAAGATLILSLLLPFGIRPMLIRLGIVDVPNERSSHERPVLRGLGLAVLISLVVGWGLALLALVSTGADQLWWQALLVVLLGSTAAGLLGLAEDIRGVSVPVRSLVLLVIGVGTGWVLVEVPGGEFHGWGWWVRGLLIVYAVLFISSYINVANFMDGLNGISGFHGVIAGVAFAIAGLASGESWLFAAGLVLAAGFLGFLPWNLTKPGGFLGDVGAYLLGGATAVLSFAALAGGVPILATIGPMIIYFGDVGVTLVKRVRAGHKWDEPHKEHVYQRLQQTGLSHVQASGITALFTAAASALGLASYLVPPIWWLALLVAGLALLALYLAMPRLLGSRRARHARLARTPDPMSE